MNQRADTRAAEAAIAIARGDVAKALTGHHQPLTERKPTPRSAPSDHTTILARRLERLARQALPAELQRLRREPGEIWLLAHDRERIEHIDANHKGRGMAPFNAADARDVSRVARNDCMRERRRVTSAGNARQIGTGEGEVEVAGTSMASAAADLQLEAEQVLAALRTGRLVDDQWHRAVARPATCGDVSDDAEALPVAVAAELLGFGISTVQTHMREMAEVESAGGQLVLPCVPPVAEVYAARPGANQETSHGC